MNITVIHGDDMARARERFGKIIDAIKTRGWDIIHLDGSNLSLAENLSSNSLFENKKLYVVEDLDKFKPKELEWFQTHSVDNDNNLLILVEGSIPAKLKFLTPKIAKFEEFKLTKTLFQFLDSLYPGNAATSVKMLHQTIQNDPIELVFSLMGTTMRDLYWVLTGPQSFAGPAWKKDRLTRQAKKYSSTQLWRIIQALADIDIAVKTSNAELLPSLDLLILSELE